MNTQSDIFERLGEKLRDEGIERVTNKGITWHEQAVDTFIQNRLKWRTKHDPIMGEDIRWLIAKEIGNPHHPNSWGAVVMNLVRKGYLVNTGVYKKARSPASHAHVFPTYRII